METKIIKIGNFKINNIKRPPSINNYDGFRYTEFNYLLKDKEQLIRFFKLCRSKAFTSNFGGDEYNTNSYIKIKYGDDVLTIMSPKHTNGDNNWWEYNKYHKKSVIVQLREKIN